MTTEATRLLAEVKEAENAKQAALEQARTWAAQRVETARQQATQIDQAVRAKLAEHRTELAAEIAAKSGRELAEMESGYSRRREALAEAAKANTDPAFAKAWELFLNEWR